MTRETWRKLGLIMLALMVTPGLVSESAGQPLIDPEADAVLREMAETLESTPAAHFRVSDTIDDVQENGQKLQFAHVRDMTVVRPDKLKIVTMGDVTNRVLWKNGKNVTVLDRDLNVYAQVDDAGTIDEAIHRLQHEFGMSTPAADLLSEDPYATLTEGCQEILYIGLGYAGDEMCHHLAFTRENIDYQLWVSTGPAPRPRKIVITYKLLPESPQYTLQLLEAKHAGDIAEDAFEPQIPDDAVQIVFHPINAAD